MNRPIGISQRAIAAPTALVLALLCNACGRSDAEESASDLPANELYNRIEAARKSTAESEASPRLGKLSEAVLPAGLRAAPCRLIRGDALLLVADTARAAAHVDGRVMLLEIGGPLGTSGGYFTARGVSISIGATDHQPGLADGHDAARVSVGGTPGKPVQKLDARWSCPISE